MKISIIIITICIYASAFGQMTCSEISEVPKNLRVQDIDGNYYNTVKIGNQRWMAENLKTTKYADGSEIPMVPDNAAWSALTNGGYCWYYNDSETHKKTYGAIYNWYAVVDKRNLCFKGWHIPSDSEWTVLVSYLGGTNVAGGKLKENSILHWVSPNTGATNESGFTALPGGDRHDNGPFYDIGYYCYWWSSTEKDATKAWMYEITNNSPKINRGYFTKNDGFYVRCIRD